MTACGPQADSRGNRIAPRSDQTGLAVVAHGATVERAVSVARAIAAWSKRVRRVKAPNSSNSNTLHH